VNNPDLSDAVLPIPVLQLRSCSGFFGAENVVLEIAKGLRRSRYRPIVGLLANNPSSGVELADRARSCGIESVIFVCNRRFDFATIDAIRTYVRKHQIAILHPHGYRANVYSLVAGRRMPVKRVTTCHPWTERSYSRRARFYAWLDQTLLPRFDHVVAVCDDVRDEILQTRVRAEAVSVIENGIDLERFAVRHRREDVCRELGLPLDRFLIGTIGRMVPEKGHDLLIKAAAKLKETHTNAYYVIAGDGDLLQPMQRLAADLGVADRFRFLGVCDRVPELLSALDVFILPSVSEGLPMVILEAMAARKPIITTRVGAIPQILVHEQSALIVDPDSSTLAAAASRLIENPDIGRRLSENGFQHVRSHYSSDTMARRYAEVFDRVRGG
jgi:glycosyltransferase involved in cell wall biosynthesis